MKEIKLNDEKIVPDTSVLIEGLLSSGIEKNTIKIKEIIIHEASLAELESQANKKRETGILGLEEIKRLQDLSEKKKITLLFKGARPEEFEIRYAKAGEIDSLIRQLAYNEKAVLFTADYVQAMVARAKGIVVLFYEFEKRAKKRIPVERYFDSTTMSVHIKENCFIKAKKGMPGKWEFKTISKQRMLRNKVKNLAKDIVEVATKRRDSFIEFERKGSTIVQSGRYRIVITKPPFSEGYEITVVRPVKTLRLEDYKLSQKLLDRLDKHAEGILISGSPGHGKTTFAQALAVHYAKQNKVIKTIEVPRDLDLPSDVTQYSLSHGSQEEIRDIMLLSRPDYTIFDEVRNFEDFKLFSDLRLSGVGMVGVIHATQTIDAVQRFLGKIEMGVIPHVIDTVVFIKNGSVDTIYSLKMEVKVPEGMTEADLARPVIVINDFETDTPKYEMYTYGEQTVVIPVTGIKKTKPLYRLAAEAIKREFSRYGRVEVEVESDNKCTIYVPESMRSAIIGRGGENISKEEEMLGMRIEIKGLGKTKKKTQELASSRIKFKHKRSKKSH